MIAMHAVLIILLSTLAAIVYGIAHDLITTRICLEYFTVAHPPIFGGTHSLTLLALGWGVIATWWVGLPLGFLLAAAARVGNLPKLIARDFFIPLAIGLVIMLALAMCLGAYAFSNIPIPPRFVEVIPLEHHRHFMFNAAAHLASYAMGPILGIVLCIWSIIIRVRRNRHEPRPLFQAWNARP